MSWFQFNYVFFCYVFPPPPSSSPNSALRERKPFDSACICMVCGWSSMYLWTWCVVVVIVMYFYCGLKQNCSLFSEFQKTGPRTRSMKWSFGRFQNTVWIIVKSKINFADKKPQSGIALNRTNVSVDLSKFLNFCFFSFRFRTKKKLWRIRVHENGFVNNSVVHTILDG